VSFTEAGLDNVGSTEALAWAFSKALPPKQKLLLIYLADGYRQPKELDFMAAAAFAGIATHEVGQNIRALRRAELVRFDANVVQIRYGA